MMNKTLNTIFVLLFVATLALGFSISPKTARAEGPVQETGPNLFESIIQTISGGSTAASNYSLQLKEYVLDPIASGLAKTIIRQLTADIVNWINSGFEGSPAFIQNPAGFLIDTADQITGDFLKQYGGPLTSLCSPFSIDIRLALAFKYHPNIQKKYACTLGTIISNTVNAANNATLNGQRISNFVGGDFNQGGWPAFISLTTEPQNNAYGAYLTADSELSLRVASAKVQKRDELSNGKGFLSWRDPKCKASVNSYNANLQKTNEAKAKANDALTTNDSPDGGYLASSNGQVADDPALDGINLGGEESSSYKSVDSCPIMTPGSTIQASIQNNLDGPLRQLELADEIDEIVGALFSQLIKVTLQTGLGAISGTSPSDSTSYIQKIQAEANSPTQQGNQLNALRNDFLTGVEKYISDTLDFQSAKDQSYGYFLDAKNAYDDVTKCYDDRLNGITPPILNPTEEEQARKNRMEAQNKEDTDVIPTYTKLEADTQKAEDDYNTLADIKLKANQTTSLDEFNTIAQKFTDMVRNQQVIQAADIVHAQEEASNLKSTAAILKSDAENRLTACKEFPGGAQGATP